ncbi:Calx-beta domain-containing protein [Sneathiella limimaris]|uniref:T1SS-143 repeat domain-containing protein n=1 Tax=Sneathiella limimaris TaxID=1964213 RepID=UPI00146E99C5|nr:FecR domain-containing protein [Sneathiella limimaris]
MGSLEGKAQVEGMSGDLLGEYTSSGNSPVHLGGEFLPLTAEFTRDGTDLYLENHNGDYIVVRDYFSTYPGPDLISQGGAKLTADIVSRLAGPGPVAQSGATQTDASPIGQITEASGAITIKHADGTSEEGFEGSMVFKGDVLETGSDGDFVIVFVDDTQFSMGPSGRAVLDDLVYNTEDKSENGMGVTLLQGVFSFVSGKIAKDDHDSVDIRTPVGTIGIRGTSWSGKVAQVGEESIFTLFTGAILVANEGGSELLSLAQQTVIVTSSTVAPSKPFVLTEEQLIDAYGKVLQLINPDWSEDEEFDPSKINPEAGPQNGGGSGGGAGFSQPQLAELGDGLGLGGILGLSDLLNQTDLTEDEFRNLLDPNFDPEEPSAEVKVVGITDPETKLIVGFEVQVLLDTPSEDPIKIFYEVIPGTATSDSSVLGGLDYLDLGGGVITLLPGETFKSFSVDLVDDDVIEGMEFFIVQLTGAENANIDPLASQAIIYIEDDDIGVISIKPMETEVPEGPVAFAAFAAFAAPEPEADSTVNESDGVVQFRFVLDKAVAPGVEVRVDYTVVGEGASRTGLTPGETQSAYFSGGTDGLPAGSEIVVSIPLLDDDGYQGTQGFTIQVVGASSNAVIDQSESEISVTVEDDETPVLVSDPEDADVAENSDGDSATGVSLGLEGGSGNFSSIVFADDQSDFQALGLTSGGVAVTLSGMGTSVLTGMAGDQEVFVVTLNADGTYDFELMAGVDHLSDEDIQSLTFAFEAEDTNGSSANGDFSVNIEDSATPSAGAVARVSVDEDDLPDGGDTTKESTTSGAEIPISFNGDGPGSVELDISGLPEVTSDGDPVIYSLETLEDGVTQILTATAQPGEGEGRTVFTLEFAPNGNGDNYAYSVTLFDNLDHPDEGEDELEFNLGLIIEDQDGDQQTGSFTFAVKDDIPVAFDDAETVEAVPYPNYNLTFILDSSGSMNEEVEQEDGTTKTRMEILKESVSNLLNGYSEIGGAFNITLIEFSTSSNVRLITASVQEALDYINSPIQFHPQGSTNYREALADNEDGAQGVLSEQLNNEELAGYLNTVYFISDGAPFPTSNEVPVGENGENAWQTFVDENGIEVIVVGVGNNLDTDQLALVDNSGDDPIIIDDANDLDDVLTGTLPEIAEGNIVSNGIEDQLGADGATVTQISFEFDDNGQIAAYEDAGGTVTDLGGGFYSVAFDIPEDGTPLEVSLANGSKFSIDNSGEYRFEAAVGVPVGTVNEFTYTLVDGDGDLTTATLSFSFVEDGELPVASVLSLEGGSLIEGDEFANLLEGFASDDTLVGGAGDDSLGGGGGDDLFYGGSGADIFFITGDDDGEVTIADFDVAEDTVDLDALFDAFSIGTDDRGEGDAWQLEVHGGVATLTFAAADTPEVKFANITDPDTEDLQELASRISVGDES